MSSRDDFDGLVTDWLHQAAPPRAPRRVLSTTVERVAQIGQERSVDLRFPRWTGGSVGLRWAIAGALLAAALVGAIAGAGALLRREASVMPPGVANGWIAFTSEGRTRASESDIWLAREGIEEFRLTGSDSDVTREVCPQFSPDGTRLLYVQGPAGNPAPETGAEMVRVSLGPSGQPVGPEIRVPLDSWSQICPRWSPDGQTVAFVESGNSLWIARGDGSEERVAVVAPETGTLSQVSWSPDGTAIAAIDTSGDSLWIVPIDGTGPRVLQRAMDGVEFVRGLTGEGPRFSADGTRIAVPAQGSSGLYLLVLSVDGRGAPVELDGGDVFAWSPTGHELAYVRSVVREGVEVSEIAVATFDDAPDRTIAADPHNWIRGLAWAPDGGQVVYVVGDESGQLMVVPAAGEEPPEALTLRGYSFEWTTSDDISWQAVIP
jgi:dipeptidyl aminopeptidase/acylaminoacyl peptidase